MRILVLGATGGLGGRLAKNLNSQKFDVLAQGRNPEKLKQLTSFGLTCLQSALDDPALTKAVVSFGPDVIINAAGKSGFSRGKDQYANANVKTVEQAVRLARTAGNCRLVHFSSPSVSYRAHDCLNIVEGKPFSLPVSGYAWSRQQAELILNAAVDLPITILRLRSAYGFGATSPVEGLRQRIAALKYVPLVRKGLVAIDVVHVDDVVEAVTSVVRLSQKSDHAIYNIAGPQALTFKEIVDGLAAYDGKKPKWLPVPEIALAFAGPIAEVIMLALDENREPDISAHLAGSLLYSQTLCLDQIKLATGWSPKIPFRDAIQRRLI